MLSHCAAMNRPIARAALAGFLISGFWIVLGFLMFNGPNGLLANPILYALIAWALSRLINPARD